MSVSKPCSLYCSSCFIEAKSRFSLFTWHRRNPSEMETPSTLVTAIPAHINLSIKVICSSFFRLKLFPNQQRSISRLSSIRIWWSIYANISCPNVNVSSRWRVSYSTFGCGNFRFEDIWVVFAGWGRPGIYCMRKRNKLQRYTVLTVYVTKKIAWMNYLQ